MGPPALSFSVLSLSLFSLSSLFALSWKTVQSLRSIEIVVQALICAPAVAPVLAASLLSLPRALSLSLLCAYRANVCSLGARGQNEKSGADGKDNAGGTRAAGAEGGDGVVPQKQPFPRSVLLIVGNELCER